MEFLTTYQWHIFIGLEVASLLFVLSFLVIRYALSKEKLARVFMVLFIGFILLEALLAFVVYLETGVIETFQVVIFIFIVYACTFGIGDFQKLDRMMKGIIGKWRGIDLLTEEDKRKIAHLKKPRVIRRKNIIWALSHTVVFVVVQVVLWWNYGNTAHDPSHYVTDWAWFTGEAGADLPYTSELAVRIIQVWLIIYVLDIIIALSYILFPGQDKN